MNFNFVFFVILAHVEIETYNLHHLINDFSGDLSESAHIIL